MSNLTYGGSQTLLGYAGCRNGVVQGNYLVGASPLLLDNCQPTMTGNALYSVFNYGFGTMPSAYPANTYYRARPTGTIVRVRPNKYERGRANITVYNWDRKSTVMVDLTGSGLAVNDGYEIRTAQNFYGPPRHGNVQRRVGRGADDRSRRGDAHRCHAEPAPINGT